MPRPPREPSAEELALWQAAMRDATPLHERELAQEPPDLPAVEPSSPVKLSRPNHQLPATQGTSAKLDPSGPVDLDRRTWQKLRRGRYRIESRLDLHGLTQAQAFAELSSHLSAAQARGVRCVLVITGLGLRHGGTLRRMVPQWLDHSNRAIVLSYVPAQIRDGGDGALYVLLRRGRSVKAAG